MSQILGIDVGGSGIKGAIVDVEKGVLLTNRVRIPTPPQSDPEKVLDIINYIKEVLEYEGPIGIGVPGAVLDGQILRAVNLSDSWVDFDALDWFKKGLNATQLGLINDADAAALAEYKFGDWPEKDDLSIFLTIGTGIGSAILDSGTLIRNTELGHLRLKKKLTLEGYASNSARKQEQLSWKKWGERFNTVLEYLNFIFTQPNFVLGGGVAKKVDNYKSFINADLKWRTAKLGNEAGIIGAALAAVDTK